MNTDLCSSVVAFCAVYADENPCQVAKDFRHSTTKRFFRGSTVSLVANTTPKAAALSFPASLREGPEGATYLLLAFSVASVLLSIAISQLLLAGALTGALWVLARRDQILPVWPGITWPVLCFFLWSVLAALASSDALLGLTIVKKFFIFLILFLVPLLARGRSRAIWVYHAMFVFAAISSVAGLAQFIADPHRDLLHRISGFMSQWMTYSGLQMLVLVALASYGLVFGWRKRWWVPVLGLLLCGSLCLSFTRNAWLGAVAGVAVVLLFRRPRALAGFAALLLAALLLSPPSIRQRLRAGLDVRDATTRGRLELVGVSLRLIRDNLWFGVGPKNVNAEALRYRGTREFPDWLYQHMHNNFLQIAAERGIPGLLLWLWLMGRLAWDALRILRSHAADAETLFASTAALGAWTALLVSGMFEYNFGDSEVLTLFFFLMSAPHAAIADGTSAS